MKPKSKSRLSLNLEVLSHQPKVLRSYKRPPIKPSVTWKQVVKGRHDGEDGVRWRAQVEIGSDGSRVRSLVRSFDMQTLDINGGRVIHAIHDEGATQRSIGGLIFKSQAEIRMVIGLLQSMLPKEEQ